MTEKHPDVFIWSSIKSISNNLETISTKLIDYQKLLFQLSTLIDNKYIEKYHFSLSSEYALLRVKNSMHKNSGI